MRREHVDTAAVVYAVGIRLPPCALRNVHDARQNTRCDSGWDDQLAALIPHADKVAVVDVSCGGVNRVDENSLGECLLQPVVVCMCRMDSRERVMSDGLQCVLSVIARAHLFFARSNLSAVGDCFVGKSALLAMTKGMFPFLNIFRHGGDFVGIAHVVQFFGEDFDFAAGGVERIFRRVALCDYMMRHSYPIV